MLKDLPKSLQGLLSCRRGLYGGAEVSQYNGLPAVDSLEIKELEEEGMENLAKALKNFKGRYFFKDFSLIVNVFKDSILININKATIEEICEGEAFEIKDDMYDIQGVFAFATIGKKRYVEFVLRHKGLVILDIQKSI